MYDTKSSVLTIHICLNGQVHEYGHARGYAYAYTHICYMGMGMGMPMMDYKLNG